uniref:Uncharacterized protein n=1 Tax=Arundo donax TaxID=35708 RepID=A0A0A8XNS1_ARUDO
MDCRRLQHVQKATELHLSIRDGAFRLYQLSIPSLALTRIIQLNLSLLHIVG